MSLATTAPEFAVSVQAALLGHPERSLGNAVGSVIVDDGVAMALAGIVASTAILVNCRVVRIIGSFLLAVDFFAYLLVMNGEINRIEGVILLGLLVLYFIVIIFMQKRKKGSLPCPDEPLTKKSSSDKSKKKLIRKYIFYFIGGIIGVVITSRIIIWSAVHIAHHFSISETFIGLTVIAIGTSLPEISTAVTAALKGEGELEEIASLSHS